MNELKNAQFEQIKEMRFHEKEKKIAAEKVNEFILDQQQLQSKFDQTIGKYEADLKLNYDNLRREKVQLKAEIYNLKKKVGHAQQTQKSSQGSDRQRKIYIFSFEKRRLFRRNPKSCLYFC